MTKIANLRCAASIAAAALFACLFTTSCIDNDFRIDEVSTEITVGGDEVVIPLGQMERKTLGEILGEEMDFLKTNENGLYTISFSSAGDNPDKWEHFSIDGVTLPAITGLSPKTQSVSFTTEELPTTINVSSIEKRITVDYPTIKQLVKFDPISMKQNLEFDIPNVISGLGNLSATVASLLPELTYNYVGKTAFKAQIDMPDEIKKLDYVLFGDETHPHGAPFDIELDLNGLADVNGGTTIDLDFIFPEGYYLRDSNGNDLEVHNHLIKTVSIAEKQGKMTLHLYLHKIDYSNEEYLPGSHTIDINDEIEYHIDLRTKFVAGGYNMNSPAWFSINAEPTYKDVEIIVDHFTIPDMESPISYSFSGLTDDIKVKKIAFADAPLNIHMTGIEWLTADVYTRIQLPSCFKFNASENPSYFDTTTNCLTATINQLHDGITLKLDAIDCTTDECSHKDGELSINTKIITSLDTHLLDGHELLLSQVIPQSDPVEVLTSIGGSKFHLDMARCEVEFGSEQVFNFNLTENIPSIDQTVELPKEIVSVDYLTVGKAGTDKPVSIAMKIAVPQGAGFPVNEANLNFAVNLGKMLRPTQRMFDEGIITKSAAGDNIFVVKESWRPAEGAFTRTIEVEALENLPAVSEDGKMRIQQSFPVTGSVTIADGQNIDLSNTNAAIEIDIAIDDIEIRTFTGKIGVEAAPANLPKVELGDLAGMGLDIKSMTINPVIRFTLKDNPIGVPFEANMGLQSFDAAGQQLKSISIPKIVIAGTGRSEVILSTSANRALYEGKEGITFVCVDELMKLLEGELPSSIAIDMRVCTDSTNSYTLDLASAKDGFDIDYQYEVTIPLSFDGDLNISYSDSITGLNSTFADLAGYNVGVGDISIMADFGTTIPFNLILQADLLDTEGKKLEGGASLNLEECVIDGYRQEDGEKRESQLTLGLQLGENGSTDILRDVDGIAFSLMLCNSDGSKSELRADQFIEADLKLRLRGGITIDFKDMFPTNE